MDGAFWIWGGSLFQRVHGGNKLEKARSPYRVLVRGPWINCIEEDERRNLAEGGGSKGDKVLKIFGGKIMSYFVYKK